MPQNMGQMIQMLSVLGEMQDRRKQLALDERKLKQQGEQFATTAGIQKDDARFARVQSLMKSIAEGGTTAAVAVHDLAPLLNFTPEEAQQFAHLAPNATASLQQIQGRAAQFNLDRQQQGYNSMDPAAQTTFNQEAAKVGQTNQGSGAYATGQLIGQIAGRGQQSMNQNPELAKRVGEAYVYQQGARQTPDQWSQGQAFINGGMGPAAASIAAGITPSAGQMLGFDANMADARLRAGAGAGNISDTVSAIGQMHQIAKDIADGKYADTGTRDRFIQQYNTFARLLSTQGVTIEGMAADGSNAGASLGRLEKWINKIGGNNTPPALPSAGRGGGKGGGGNPGAPTGGMRY